LDNQFSIVLLFFTVSTLIFFQIFTTTCSGLSNISLGLLFFRAIKLHHITLRLWMLSRSSPWTD